MTSDRAAALEDLLFPDGPPPATDGADQPLLDQYRLMVESSERVVARRQTANTFFLSINSALLIAAGLLFREGDVLSVAGGGIGAALSVTGLLICFVWWRMVTSFRQLNVAKFRIIHLLEQHLPAAIFKAEWTALGEGADPSLYRPFTRLETWIPKGLMLLYSSVAIVGIAVALVSGIN